MPPAGVGDGAAGDEGGPRQALEALLQHGEAARVRGRRNAEMGAGVDRHPVGSVGALPRRLEAFLIA